MLRQSSKAAAVGATAAATAAAAAAAAGGFLRQIMRPAPVAPFDPLLRHSVRRQSVLDVSDHCIELNKSAPHVLASN